jgi:hypothetical protein
MAKSPILDTIEHVAGYGVGALSALTSLKGGGLQNYFINRQRQLEDPAFRASLVDSPFTSGVFWQPGSDVAAAAPGAMPAAAATVQPADFVGPSVPAPAVAAPNDVAWLAQQTPGRHFVPSLSPLSAETQVQVQAAQGIVSGLQSADPLVRSQAKLAGKIPLTLEETRSAVGAGMQLQGSLGPGSTVGLQIPGMPIQLGSPYNVAPVGADEYRTYDEARANLLPNQQTVPTIHGTFKNVTLTREQTLPLTPPPPAMSGQQGAPGALPAPRIQGQTGPPPTPTVPTPPGPQAAAQPQGPLPVYPAQGFVVHHSGGTTLEGLRSTLADRGLGSEYLMDRDGTIYPYGGAGSPHMQPNDRWGGIAPGLTNKNAVGMEVVARDNNDVTPAQIASAQKFIAANYPDTPVYGHGEVNPGHKQADEGMAIVNAIRGSRGVAVATTPTTRPSLLARIAPGGVAYAATPPPGATVQGAPAFDPNAVVPHVVVPAPATADATVGYPPAAPELAPGTIVPAPIPALRPPGAPAPARRAAAIPGAPAPAAALPGIPVDPQTGLPLQSRTYESQTGSETYTAPPRGDVHTQMLLRYTGITDPAITDPAKIVDYFATEQALKDKESMDKATIERTQRGLTEGESTELRRLTEMKTAVNDFVKTYADPAARAQFLGLVNAPMQTLRERLGWQDAQTIRDFRNSFAPFSLESLTDEKGKAQPGMEGIAQMAPSVNDSPGAFESNLQHFNDALDRRLTIVSNLRGMPVGAATPALVSSWVDQLQHDTLAQRLGAFQPGAAPPPATAPAAASPPPSAAPAPWQPNWVR